jgi:hypothetical protein
LLEAVLAGTRRLRGALRTGYPDVFDAPDGKLDDDTRARIAFAQSGCRYTSRKHHRAIELHPLLDRIYL